MEIELDDILKVNIVLLGIQILSTPEQRQAFRESVETEVIEGPQGGIGVTIGISPGGVVPETAPMPLPPLVLNRERITLLGVPGRSDIIKDFPSDDQDITRLTNIAQRAIECSDLREQPLQAYGFNLDAVYNLSVSAGSFLSQHILQPGLFEDSGYRVVGGASNLQLMKDSHMWNIRIEPRLGNFETKKVFVSFNLHRDSQAIPTEAELHNSLSEVWTQAKETMRTFRENQ